MGRERAQLGCLSVGLVSFSSKPKAEVCTVTEPLVDCGLLVSHRLLFKEKLPTPLRCLWRPQWRTTCRLRHRRRYRWIIRTDSWSLWLVTPPYRTLKSTVATPKPTKTTVATPSIRSIQIATSTDERRRHSLNFPRPIKTRKKAAIIRLPERQPFFLTDGLHRNNFAEKNH